MGATNPKALFLDNKKVSLPERVKKQMLRAIFDEYATVDINGHEQHLLKFKGFSELLAKTETDPFTWKKWEKLARPGADGFGFNADSGLNFHTLKRIYQSLENERATIQKDYQTIFPDGPLLKELIRKQNEGKDQTKSAPGWKNAGNPLEVRPAGPSPAASPRGGNGGHSSKAAAPGWANPTTAVGNDMRRLANADTNTSVVPSVLPLLAIVTIMYLFYFLFGKRLESMFRRTQHAKNRSNAESELDMFIYELDQIIELS